MPELKRYDGVVIDCMHFDEFVEDVYGRKYSTVNGYAGDERLGHYTYFHVDTEQYMFDKEYVESGEHQKWVERMKELYPDMPWLFAEDAAESDYVTFEEWSQKEGWDAHNNCPPIDEMVYHLRKDGYDVPDKFLVLVDW